MVRLQFISGPSVVFLGVYGLGVSRVFSSFAVIWLLAAQDIGNVFGGAAISFVMGRSPRHESDIAVMAGDRARGREQ